MNGEAVNGEAVNGEAVNGEAVKRGLGTERRPGGCRAAVGGPAGEGCTFSHGSLPPLGTSSMVLTMTMAGWLGSRSRRRISRSNDSASSIPSKLTAYSTRIRSAPAAGRCHSRQCSI